MARNCGITHHPWILYFTFYTHIVFCSFYIYFYIRERESEREMKLNERWNLSDINPTLASAMINSCTAVKFKKSKKKQKNTV